MSGAGRRRSQASAARWRWSWRSSWSGDAPAGHRRAQRRGQDHRPAGAAGDRAARRGAHPRWAAEVLFDAGAGVDLPTEERGIAYVPQDYALFPHLTAGENVEFALGCLPRRRPRAGSGAAEARALLDRLGVGRLRRPPAGGAVRRRAAAGGAGPGAGPRAARAAVRRAVRRAGRQRARRGAALPARAAGGAGPAGAWWSPTTAPTWRRWAPTVLVLEAGRVVQRGTLAELRGAAGDRLRGPVLRDAVKAQVAGARHVQAVRVRGRGAPVAVVRAADRAAQAGRGRAEIRWTGGRRLTRRGAAGAVPPAHRQRRRGGGVPGGDARVLRPARRAAEAADRGAGPRPQLERRRHPAAGRATPARGGPRAAGRRLAGAGRGQPLRPAEAGRPKQVAAKFQAALAELGFGAPSTADQQRRPRPAIEWNRAVERRSERAQDLILRAPRPAPPARA